MLYNITFRLEDESTRLIPRVPYSAAEDEDRVTKRVCFTDSVENCIAALSSCNRNLYTGCGIVVRSVDESVLDPFKLVMAEELFYTGKVPDALETNECWYLDEVDVQRDVYMVKDFVYERDLAFTCITMESLIDIIRKYKVYGPAMKNMDTEWAYVRAAHKLYAEGRYDDLDDFEEEVAGLPWAQRVRVTGLVMERKIV